MRHSEGFASGVGQRRLFEQAWLPEIDGDIEAVVVIAHGYAEHSGRYAHVVDHLVPLGYAVHALDHRGHGRSDGVKGLLDGFSEAVDDLCAHIGRAAAAHPGQPVFLLGHSMGGALAMAAALRSPELLRGLALSGPLFDASRGTSGLLRTIAKLIAAIAPKMGTVGFDSKIICRDEHVVRAYDADRLVFHGRIRARTAVEMLRGTQEVVRAIDRLQVTILIQHGAADNVVDVATSRALHEKVGSTDKTLRVYEDLFHEIFNEVDRKVVLEDLSTWLLEHRGPRLVTF